MVLGLTLPLFHLQIVLESIVTGAITGSAYSLFGMGVSLSYQSSRVVNFAQGSMGVIPALFVASEVVDHGWSYWVALPVALALAAAIGALMELLVVRRLARSPRLVVLVATIAVAQLLLIPGQFMVNLNHTKLGTTAFPVPVHGSVTVAGVQLTSGDLLTLVVAPLIAIGLTLFMRRTSVGMASRGMAENSEAAALAGIPTGRVSLVVWSLAGLLAGVAAILLGPSEPPLAGLFGVGGTGAISTDTGLLVRGLGAAMMGGLVYLPQIFVAGIVLGIVEAVVQWNYSSGAVNLVVVALLIGGILLRRDLRQLARGGEESSWSLLGVVRPLGAGVRRLPRVRTAHAGTVAGVLAVALVVPLLVHPYQYVLLTTVALYVLIGLSLVLLTGWGGQVSLGQAGFVGLGALVGGRLQQMGYPLLGLLLFVIAAGVVSAAIVGLPALRIRGLFLAVTTLGFSVLVDGYLTQAKWLVSNVNAGTVQILRPDSRGVNLNDELSYYYLVLGLTIIGALLLWQLRRTGVFRKLRAVRDNETMAAALSVSPGGTKLTAFVLSGAIASVAGLFLGMRYERFGANTFTAPELSLTLLAMVIVGGTTSITGVVLGALYMVGLPYFASSAWLDLLFSGGGLIVILMVAPGGLASVAFGIRDRVVRHLTGIDPGAEDSGGPQVTGGGVGPMVLDPIPRRLPELDRPTQIDIEVRDAAVRFGGVSALDGVSLHAEHGEIVGLIGPNGAGKTTLFDVLGGIVRPDRGEVLLRGDDVTALRPEERARLGLARSFQLARLFEDLTVTEVLKVALERDEPTELVPSLLGLPPSRAAERRKDVRAAELVELLGLGSYAERRAMELSTGTRRIVELGCIVAMGAEVILLDEPTGGIAQREAEAFGPVLRQLRDHLDATMIVVAHDVPMVMGLADRMYVLASGRVIAEGPPRRLARDPAVVAAYLGSESLEITSGTRRRPSARSRRRPAAAGTG